MSATGSDEREDTPAGLATTDPSSWGQGRLDRRRLIQGAAAGGAVVWALPTILSAPAQALGSCAPAGLGWSNFEIDIDNLTPAPSNFNAFIGASSTANVAFDTSGIGAGSASTAFAVPSPLGADTGSFLVLNLLAAAPGDSCSLTITFSNPVSFLNFTLLDIDLGLANWQDQLDVTSSYLGVPVALAPGEAVFNPTFVSQAELPAPGPTKVTDQFTGIFDPSGTGAGVPNNTSSANVGVGYNNVKIDKVVITYRAGPLVATPQPQQIGITDFAFCLFE